jgi:hypothetical protein
MGWWMKCGIEPNLYKYNFVKMIQNYKQLVYKEHNGGNKSSNIWNAE